METFKVVPAPLFDLEALVAFLSLSLDQDEHQQKNIRKDIFIDHPVETISIPSEMIDVFHLSLEKCRIEIYVFRLLLIAQTQENVQIIMSSMRDAILSHVDDNLIDIGVLQKFL